MFISKKSKLVVLGITILVTFSYTGYSAEGDEAAEKENTVELKPQKTCPIMGGGIDKNLYADVKGKRIYVCCKGCIEVVKKDPDAALKKLKELGEKAQNIPVPQKTCPVMTGPINKNLYYDYNGKRIYVCCEGCLNAVKKNPDTYLKKLSDIGEYADNVPVEQTICPVMGGKINKDLFVEYNGKKLYVCSKSCLETVRKNPAKYALKIAEQLKENNPEGKAEAAKEKALPKKSAKEPSVWTCFMHPEVRESKPGKCSICKMDLVPLKSKKDENLNDSETSPKSGADENKGTKIDKKKDK